MGVGAILLAGVAMGFATGCHVGGEGDGGTGGLAGAAGSASGGTDTGGAGGAGGAAGQGGSGPCHPCNDWLDPFSGVETGEVCGFDPYTPTGSAALLFTFLECVCGKDMHSGACGSSECADFCSTGALEDPCENCFSTQCLNELEACKNDD